MPSAPGIRQSMIGHVVLVPLELVDGVVAPLDGVDLVAGVARARAR